MTTTVTDYGWQGDPCDLIVAAEVDDAAERLTRYLRAARPAWMVDAACRLPEHAGIQFFPERGQSVGPAMQLCGQCPALIACRG